MRKLGLCRSCLAAEGGVTLATGYSVLECDWNWEEKVCREFYYGIIRSGELEKPETY